MLNVNGNGQVIAFQPSHDVAITAAFLPYQVIGPNKGEEQPFLIHCLAAGDVTFLTWAGQTVTRSFTAGNTYEVLAKTVTAIPNDTSFSALY